MKVHIISAKIQCSESDKAWLHVRGSVTDARIKTKFKLEKTGNDPVKLRYEDSHVLASLSQEERNDLARNLRRMVNNYIEKELTVLLLNRMRNLDLNIDKPVEDFNVKSTT